MNSKQRKIDNYQYKIYAEVFKIAGTTNKRKNLFKRERILKTEKNMNETKYSNFEKECLPIITHTTWYNTTNSFFKENEKDDINISKQIE